MKKLFRSLSVLCTLALAVAFGAFAAPTGDATAPLNVAMVKLETSAATAITATQSATSAGAFAMANAQTGAMGELRCSLVPCTRASEGIGFALPVLALAIAAVASHWRI